VYPEYECQAFIMECENCMQGRIMLDLISEPDIFGLQWTAVANRNGFQYPAIQDLYGPTMQVSPLNI
jgi:hypothetical protein